MASVVRSTPSSSAISPKTSPEPMRFRIALRPSAEEVLIFTVPLITANRLLPASPLEKIVAPRFKFDSFA